MSDQQNASWSEVFSRAYFPFLALACVGVWLHAADSLLTATMMPAIVREIGGTALISWTVALYQLGSILAGAASGLLAYRFGATAPMAIATLVFAAGCLVSALAPSMEIVLVGRLLQGLGGGGLTALAFVSANLFFPMRLIGRVIGVISAVWGTSAFFGPLVGGLFVEFGPSGYGWRLGFGFFAVQALMLALWLTVRKNPEQQNISELSEPKSLRFPIVRLLILSGSVLCISFAGINVAILKTTVLSAAGIGLLLLFLRLDSTKEDNRLLPRNALSLRTPVGAGLLMILCFSAATVPIGVYVAFFINMLHGTSELVAGYIIALESIFWALTAIVTAGLPQEKDRLNIKLGMLTISASLIAMPYAIAYGPLYLIAICAILQGAGFGMAWASILRFAVKLAPASDTHIVSSAMPTIQMLGYALGAAYIGIIANAVNIETAMGAALKFVAVVTFIGVVPVACVGLLAMRPFLRRHQQR